MFLPLIKKFFETLTRQRLCITPEAITTVGPQVGSANEGEQRQLKATAGQIWLDILIKNMAPRGSFV